MKTIQEIEKEIAELNNQIEPLIERRVKCEDELLTLKSQFKIGDVIIWRGRKGRVEGIKEWCCGKPMWIVRNIRKDGTDGSKCYVRDYQAPQLA